MTDVCPESRLCVSFQVKMSELLFCTYRFPQECDSWGTGLMNHTSVSVFAQKIQKQSRKHFVFNEMWDCGFFSLFWGAGVQNESDE